MSNKKRGLGRGLDALLGATPYQAPAPDDASEQLRVLPIEYLSPSPLQPRKEIADQQLQELADSIKVQGILQPILTRNVGPDRYEIIAGERRWRAAQLAGLHEIPVLVRSLDDQTALAVALIENIQRQDLTPLEEAEALQRLLDEHRLTHQQLAEAVGKSRATVTNLLRLNALHSEVKILLQQGALEMGHARALLPLNLEQQIAAAAHVVRKQLTVRATEQLVTALQRPQPLSAKTADPDVARLQDDLAGRLGAPVQIRHNGKGNGKVVISYADLDQLQQLLERIR